MHHGHNTAFNIHQHILYTRGVIDKLKYQDVVDYGTNIGLAVGKKAIMYSEQTGTVAGEDTLKYLFGNDLGFQYCWDYLKLGERFVDGDAPVKEELPEPENVVGMVAERGVAVSAEA